MVPRRKQAEEDAVAPRGPVTLRLGDLEPEIEARRADAVAPGAIVKRDLGRYYKMVNLVRKSVLFGFTLSQAEALVLAIGDTFDDAAVRYIWAEVEREYRDQANDPESRFSYLPDDFDPMPFIERLRELRPFESMVLLDAIERYWVLHFRGGNEGFSPWSDAIDGRLLVEVGLLSEVQLKRGLEAREHERKERASGKLIVRDFLGGLRTKTRGEDE